MMSKLIKKIKQAPKQPGCYIYKDKKGQVPVIIRENMIYIDVPPSDDLLSVRWQ